MKRRMRLKSSRQGGRALVDRLLKELRGTKQSMIAPILGLKGLTRGLQGELAGIRLGYRGKTSD
jgi:hypothetical protein